jgi:ribosomal protein S18 acetylase RimI-like enzyme
MTDVTGVNVRTLDAADADGLRAFFERVPEGDRTFFREDVWSPAVIAGWLASRTSRRWVAVDGDTVTGYLAVIPQIGWSSHVAEVRLVVDPARRRQGVGKALARRGLLEGLSMGLSKLVVQVAAEQEAAVAMFYGIGFEAEALFKDHIRDAAGQLHDLVVLAHFVDHTWAAMHTTGIDEVVEP